MTGYEKAISKAASCSRPNHPRSHTHLFVPHSFLDSLQQHFLKGSPLALPNPQNIEEFAALMAANDIHTVEVAVPDTQGHLRGKRVPTERFMRIASEGLAIADAIFVFDIQCDLPDHPHVNMDTGYLDTRIVPDLSTVRILTHRPGYALVFADAYDETGAAHPLAPRGVLAAQISACQTAALDPVVATEMEFYLCTPEWEPVQSHVQYSSLTDSMEVEPVLAAMRSALIGAGLDVEGSNSEYAPGQIEINVGHADAMTVADNTVLYKSIVKQVAVEHGLRATFMPLPFNGAGGSGMHIHTSLTDLEGGGNAFASSDGAPNEIMEQWTAGLLAHAVDFALIGSPTPNGFKRIRPYTFAPTHVHWGGDNRTVLARTITEAGSKANRVEFRSPGADANPYIAIAALLAAGSDGIERKLNLPPIASGDMYGNPGDSPALHLDYGDALAAFKASELAKRLGETFSIGYACIADAELGLATEAGGMGGDEVTDWERERYIEFS